MLGRVHSKVPYSGCKAEEALKAAEGNLEAAVAAKREEMMKFLIDAKKTAREEAMFGVQLAYFFLVNNERLEPLKHVQPEA